MRNNLQALGLALLTLAAMTVPTDMARAQCDVPLVINRTAGEANVLIIFDSSGSMNTAIMDDAYDPNVTYSGNFDSGMNYDVWSSGNYTPSSFDGNWPTSPNAYLVTSDGGQAADYPGNYLNWVYFHATSSQRSGIPRATRVQVAKQVINTVLGSKSANTSYGVMKFNGDVGGLLVSPIGTPIATLQSQVNAIVADGYTPLAETMVTAMDYFKRTDASAPIKGSCQKSFVILISDGFPTRDLNIPDYLKNYWDGNVEPCSGTDCSGYLDDVATYVFANDLRTDMDGLQNLTTFVIGFNVDAPILPETAVQGGGSYYSALNPAQLAAALSSALTIIETKVSAGASVSVVSSEEQTNDRLYRARFESVSWRGFVEAYALPYQTGDPPVWQAGELLKVRDPATRTLFTSTTGSNKLDFSSTNATTLQPYLAAADLTAATNIINYTRGASIANTRDRAGWKLGDIVDSSPVAVGKPSSFYDFLSYPSFRSNNANRTQVLYVGSNDGTLHCFNAATGAEEWAYVPRNVLPRLKELTSNAYCHSYYVNMTPAVHDIYVNGGWKTLLIGGQERGGSGLFALDVTSPAANSVSVLWDLNIPQLRGSWNRPALVRDQTLNGFALCAGTGYSDSTVQANLLVLNPANGSILATHALGSPAAGNMTTMATAFDKNFDGFDDLLYLADLSGKVWRFDLRTNPWTQTLLYSGSQPIQAAPVATLDEQGRVMLFFGTGRYLQKTDLPTTTTQSFIGLIDDGTGTTVTKTDLVNQTSAINAVTGRGWYIDLVQFAGERVTRSAALVAGTLYFPSFRPKAEVCQSGGESWLYSVDYEDGSAPDNANGSENNTTAGRVESKGDGVLSNPVVDLTNEDIILQSSNTSMVSQDIDVTLRRLMVRSWRQRWN